MVKKVADPYYLSPAWEKLRLTALRAAGWRCVTCGCGVRGQKAGQSRPMVDHIITRRKGGADDLTNLQVLCARCHGQKTAWSDYNDKPEVGLDGLAPGWGDD